MNLQEVPSASLSACVPAGDAPLPLDLAAVLVALNSHAMLSVADVHGRITYVNDKFCEISGYAPQELLGADHSLIRSLEHPPSFYAEMWSTITAGKTWRGQICNTRKDHSCYWVETSITPVLGADGLPVQYVAIRTDITHRKEAELRLRASEARLEEVHRIAALGSWEYCPATGDLLWTDQVYAIYGRDPATFRPHVSDFFGMAHPEDRAALAEAEQVALRTGETEITHRIIRPDGEVRYVLERARATFDAHGQAVRLNGTVQDVTAAHRAEQALATARAEAERTRHLNDTRLQVVRRLGRAAEYRDNETGGHVVRMSTVSALLARCMGWSPEQCELILHASPMHDVGKIGVPDSILLKPGKLTEAEWAAMRAHAEIGAELLGDDDSDLLKMAREIALTHHEKWDGSGYPRGLAGKDIPLVGRIVAVADVFDALVSARPYKAAWPLEKALAYLRDSAGTHFDPEVVACFMHNLPAILELHARYADPQESAERQARC